MAWCENKKRECPVETNLRKIREGTFVLVECDDEAGRRFAADKLLMDAVSSVVIRLGDLGECLEGPQVEEDISDGEYIGCNHSLQTEIYDLTNVPFGFSLTYNSSKP